MFRAVASHSSAQIAMSAGSNALGRSSSGSGAASRRRRQGLAGAPTGIVADRPQPRLARLERRFMHEVEGGNDKWLMRILRHETGHAIDTAFGLRRRKSWRETFGKASRRYPTRYSPRPGSRHFVR